MLPRVFVVLAACAAVLVHSRTEYQDEIPNGHRVVRNGQAWPAVGHQQANGGTTELNSFGLAFKATGFKWTTDLCKADTDGDGFTNGAELGDPDCAWRKDGSGTAQWNTSISHPGYSDSRPVGLPMVFRLHGPSLDEGVVQARVFPNPWGTVALPSTFLTSEWAKHFCYLSHQLPADPAWGSRAWGIWDRPAADRALLGPAEYVSVSEPTQCNNGVDFRSCTVRYSKLGSPQNLTNAIQGGVYVKCKYAKNNGSTPFTQRFRLRGSQPNHGYLDVFRPETNSWTLVNTSVGSLDKWSAAPRFACRTLLGYTGGHAHIDTDMWWNDNDKKDVHGALTMCDPFREAEQCYFNSTFERRVGKLLKFTCGDFVEAFSDEIGPSAAGLVFATDKDFTSDAFLTLLENRTAINKTHFVLQRWQPAPPEQNMTHGAVYVNLSYFGGVNPSVALRRVKDEDGDRFGFIASEFKMVPIASLDPTAPKSMDDFEIKIVGPSAVEGVVQARRKGSSDPWGLVQWREEQAWATAFCQRGNVSDPKYIARLTPLDVDATFQQYAPPDRYLAISDPSGCDERWQSGNMSACRFIYSPYGQPRSFTSWERAAYVECRYETFPEVRLHGYQTCWGQLEIKPTNAGSWQPAATSFTTEEVCHMVGCNCTESPAGSCSKTTAVNGYAVYYLKQCDPANAATSCQTDVFSPKVNYQEAEDLYFYHCGRPGFPTELVANGIGSDLRGPRIDSRPFGMPRIGKQQFIDLVDSRWGLASSKPGENTTMEILYYNDTAPNDGTWINADIRVYNDKPSGGIIAGLNALYSSLGYAQGNIHYSYRVGPRLAIPAPKWQYPPGVPKFRLRGSSREGEGFVQGQLSHYVWETRTDETSPWGAVVFNQYLSTEYARLFCKLTDNYARGFTQRAYTYQVTTKVNDPIATQFFKRNAYVAFNDVICRSHLVNQNPPQLLESFENNCTWLYNHIDATNYYANDRGVYVKCREPPPKWRVVGAFRGIGVPEVFVDGQWEMAYSSGLSASAICRRFAGINDPAWTPTLRYGDNDGERRTAMVFYKCEDDTDIADCPWYDYQTSTTQRLNFVECVEPPVNTAFAQTSVLYMNGVVDRAFHEAGKRAFPKKAAKVLGLDEDKVFVSQWDDQPKDDLIWVTLTLNATGINAGLALNRLAASPDLGWKATDVRPIPVYSEIAPPAWQWSVEQDRTGGKRGNIIARPSRHYAWGVPCAKSWTPALTALACKTVFGYVAPPGVPPPRHQERFLVGEDNVRNMYLDDILCDYSYAEILGNCSFAYAPGPSDRCPGRSNVYIDCEPPTMTVSKTVVEVPTTPGASTTTAGDTTTAAVPETPKPPAGPGTTGAPVDTTRPPDTTTAAPDATTAPGMHTGTALITTDHPGSVEPTHGAGDRTMPPQSTTAKPNATDNTTTTAAPLRQKSLTLSQTVIPPAPSFDAAAEETAAAVDEVLDNPLADTGAGTGVALAGAAGGSAALDMQGVMVLAAANCQTSRKTKDGGKRASNIKAVVPWRFAESPAGGVGAIIVMVVGVFALQALAAVGVKLSGHRDTWWHSFARVKCPSICHAVFVVLLQGLCLEAALCLVDESIPVMLVGAAGLLVIGAGAGGRMWLVADPRERMGVEPEPYEKLKERYHPIIALVLPSVFWHPADEDEDPDAAQMFGSLVSPCRDEFGPIVIAIQVLKRASIAASVVIAATSLPCEVSYVVVILIHLGSAAFTLAKRPLRKGMENFLTGAMDVFIMTIAASLWLGAPVWVIKMAMVAAGIVSFAAGVIAVLTWLFESRKWKPEELELDDKAADALLKGAESKAGSPAEAPLLGIPRREGRDGTDSPTSRDAARPSTGGNGGSDTTRELEAALSQLMLGGGGNGGVEAPGAAQPGGVQYLVVEEGNAVVNPLLKK